jgi:glutamine synthetase adenylyltransferase
MTRARFVMGLSSLEPRFDAVRHAVISAPRDAAGLKAEIVGMRERVRQGHPVKPGRFDVKHSQRLPRAAPRAAPRAPERRAYRCGCAAS